MDAATALVRAYLQVNGYLTATDYPLVETAQYGLPKTITDIDMLAVRLARKGPRRRQSAATTRVAGPMVVKVDPVLGAPAEHTDMIIAEIKQGRAQVNAASRNPRVLAAALARFGCCAAGDAPGLVQELLQRGTAQAAGGHVIRMVLFASRGERAPRGWHWVRLDHVFRFLDEYLRSDRGVLETVDLHDPALGWLSQLHKCGLTICSA